MSVVDDKCSPVSLLSGDTNGNHKLDVGENWKYRCTEMLTRTSTNTARATGYGDDIYRQPAFAIATATVVVGSSVVAPIIAPVKVPSQAIANVLVSLPLLPDTGLPPDTTDSNRMLILVGICVFIFVSSGLALWKWVS